MALLDSDNKFTQPRILRLDTLDSYEKIEQVLKALASDRRITILSHLSKKMASVNEIAEMLDIPASTATMHINILEDAGLIHTELKPASRGLQKVIARVYDQVVIQLPKAPEDHSDNVIDVTMPIGAFVDCQVAPTCGLVGEIGIIGELDDVASFYHPNRIYTQLLWFRHGYVEYRFPNRLPKNMSLESLQFSLELCSEAPLHNPDWPSDITVWVNQVEIGTWTSPGDFGGERGVLTPLWWDEWNTQYGMLKVWRVNREGSYVDGVLISDVGINRLNIPQQPYISLKIGVKNDGTPGGINLFGSKFGNYPQDIVMRMRFQPLAG
ncbi:MAG: helix-turn-helix domain-containing protein [Anaerolineae bacterium]|jgi:predicted transcriptional regulator|nr:helix-turn-helix domain-containing protein [Anaerolineae bacterium]